MLRLLASVVLAASSLSGLPAQAFDRSGLGDPICFKFFFGGVSFAGGKATGPNTAEYNFSGRGQIGTSGRGCTASGKVAAYPVSVTGTWDGASGRAREVITHKPPPAVEPGMVTELVAQCPSDPWVTNTSCRSLSQSTVRADGKRVGDLEYEGPVPMSAALIGPGGRAEVARFVVGLDPKFTLAPTTPPIVIAPANDQILRRGQPLKVQLQRPADGSPDWYAANKLSFDLEWEAKTRPGGSGKLAITPLWHKRALLPSVEREGEIQTIPNSELYGGDTSLLAIEGPFTTWRMRARVHDATTRRPWSSWVTVFSEPPLGAADKSSAAAATGAAPAPILVAPRQAAPRLPARTN